MGGRIRNRLESLKEANFLPDISGKEITYWFYNTKFDKFPLHKGKFKTDEEAIEFSKTLGGPKKRITKTTTEYDDYGNIVDSDWELV